MLMEANIEIMTSLADFYSRLSEDGSFPLQRSCGDCAKSFVAQVHDLIADFRMNVKRAKALAQSASNRRDLVKKAS
jgi:hypothetical protein